MLRLIRLFILLFGFTGIKAQFSEVIYDTRINRNEIVFSEQADYILRFDANKTLYEPVNRALWDQMLFKDNLIQTNDNSALLYL
ncbi:MAG: hypothetical protein Q4G27_09270 [Flavobacteriaceae bacterium]|nr:hypothetical protein [Flavobacteriaceae bacterium]